MHLKITSEILYCGWSFFQKLQVWGGIRGVYLLCLEDIDCLAPLYVPVALEQYFFSEESESLDRTSINWMV